MYRQRSEVLKWVGFVIAIGVAGWFVWVNLHGGDSEWVISSGQGMMVQDGIQENSKVGGPGAKVNGGSSGSVKVSYLGTGTKGSNHGETNISTDGNEVSRVQEHGSQKEEQLAVHTAGAVVKPGVYYLAGPARVIDAVRAAGGVTAEADVNSVNLAQPIADGDQVLIPSKAMQNQGTYTIRGGVTSGSGGSGTSGRSTGSGSGGGIASSPGSSTASTRSSGRTRININTATAEELMRLPGIGESKAGAIIRYREVHGRFQHPEDLTEVGGIGDKTFERLKEMITC